MNKADLIRVISNDAGIPSAAAHRVIEAFTNAVTGELRNGGSVSLSGFGTFSAKKSAARKGRNPRTGAEIQIAARVRPTFKPSSVLKEELN